MMNNKDTIKDLSTTITVGIIFSYIYGYLVITCLLSNYEVINDDLLNLNFLKAGFLFLIVLIPTFLIVHFNLHSLIDNQNKIIKYILPHRKPLVKRIAKSLAYSVILSIFFIDINNFDFHFLLYMYLMTMGVCFYSYSVFIIISYLGAKKFGLGHLTALLIPLCFVSYFFGSHIYGDLPPSFKGGFPSSTTIFCKVESRDYLNNIGFNFSDSTYNDKVVILYSTSEKILISKSDKYYFLSKNLFNGFKTINKKYKRKSS